MRNRPSTLRVLGLCYPIGITATAVAQDNGTQQPSARQQLQHIHTPQSIDQELAHLTETGVDFATAAASPASARGAPRWDTGAAG